MSKKFDLKDVGKHKDKKSCWLVINNSVYDVTTWLGQHPGGETVLIENSGNDATAAFEKIGHSDSAKGMMAKYKIGEIKCETKSGQASKSCPAKSDKADCS